ncbi:MAG TPA: amino acid permease, partial [Nitrososphaeria archaeon]|nr:amino acid permease [Nitrososphaeria archaeon]
MEAKSGGRVELKREVGWFSSFAMGYGDVGADIFIALGIVTLYAGGAAPLTFLIAALIYVAIGLAYAELAPTYPYAGGVQVYTMRASNSLMGFLAGWTIMLSYTIDISLFSAASAGYLKYLIPQVKETTIQVLGLSIPSLGVIAAGLVAVLIVINYIGIKYSAGMISALVALGLLVQALILGLGFGTAFDLKLFLNQIVDFGNANPLREVEYIGFFDVKLSNLL